MDEYAQRLQDGITNATTGDALDRALAATELYTWGREELMPLVASLRRAAVRELRAEGYSLREVAELLGVTDARVSQIVGA